jgi:hypothetical protein
MRREELRRVE